MDSITQSIWQGFNMAHSIDQDKRLREAQQIQAQQHQQQILMQQLQMREILRKSAQEQADRPALLEKQGLERDKLRTETSDLMAKAQEAARIRKVNESIMSQSQDVNVPATPAVADPNGLGNPEFLQGTPGRTETAPLVRAAQAPYAEAQHPLIKQYMQTMGRIPAEAATVLQKKTAPTDYTMGNKRYSGTTNEVVATGEPTTAGTPSSNSVTEKGGFPIWKDPKTLQSLVVKPDGTREAYDPKVHGRELSQNLSQTTIINQANTDKESFNSWLPEEKEQAFGYNMITGKPPENARGMRANDRQAYAKGYAKWQLEKGYKPSDVALMQADYRAGNMSLSNMTKQEAPMSAFVGNINRQIEKVRQLYDNNDRVGLRLIDKPVRDLKLLAKGSGDEAVKASYLLEISNEIGKLSSGASASVQQLSDSAKEDWKKVHDPNLSFKEIMKVVNATRDQANMRIATWREAKEAVRTNLKELGVSETPSAVSSPKPTHRFVPGKGIVEVP